MEEMAASPGAKGFREGEAESEDDIMECLSGRSGDLQAVRSPNQLCLLLKSHQSPVRRRLLPNGCALTVKGSRPLLRLGHRHLQCYQLL